MHVVVYEPSFTGHHFAYLGRLMPALADLPCQVTLCTCPAAIESDPFRIYLAPHQERFSVAPLCQTPGTTGDGSATQTTDLLRCLSEIDIDHLYIPYLDGLSTGIARKPSLGWGSLFRKRGLPETEALSMRGKYIYETDTAADRLKGFVAKRLLLNGPWQTIHHLDPRAIKKLGGDPARLDGRLRLMPDPIEASEPLSKEAGRQALNLSTDGQYLGMLGGIDRRKGADFILKAFRRVLETGQNIRLLLAGKVTDEVIRQQLESEYADLVEQGRIIAFDRYQTPEDLRLARAACDVVGVYYPDHLHSASIAIVAAAAERPVLASSIGWLRGTVEPFQLGVAVPPSDTDALTAAIPTALAMATNFQLTEAGKRFVAFHSEENFVAHFTLRLRQRLGLPEPKNLVRWSSVVEALEQEDPDQEGQDRVRAT